MTVTDLRPLLWLAEAGPQPRRAFRLEGTLAVVRAVLVLLTIPMLTSLETDLPGALSAHLVLLVLCAVPVLAFPAAHRNGDARTLGFTITLTTLAFYVGYTLAFHDTPGAGTALGLLALLEAPIRYGPRGALLSLPPVLAVALTHPQQDSSGYAPSGAMSLALCALLLGATLSVRAAWRRSTGAADAAQEDLAQALLHLPLGVAVVDSAGRLVQVNPALADLLGAPDRALLAGRLLADLLPTPRPGTADLRAALPQSGWDYETDDGRWLAVGSAPVQLSAAPILGAVVHVSDVTTSRQQHADLLHVARHDALTGLLTRAAGEQALGDALRAHAATAVLFLDLDDFKHLNDTAGHAAGDAVLRRAAARVRGGLRPTEAAVRWGGDEIVVVCRDVNDDAELQAVSSRLLAALREPFSIAGTGRVTVGVSIGAARAWPGARPEDLVKAADDAMYDAKRAGGDRCALAADPASGTGRLPAQRPAPGGRPGQT